MPDDPLREKVFTAAQGLADKGERVSVRTVRAALGGGSPNEITPHVKAWKEAHEALRQEVQQLDHMPEDARGALQDPLNALLARVWSTLREYTAKEIDALRAAHADETGKLREEVEDQTALAGDLANEFEQSTRQATALATRLKTSEAQVEELREQVGELRERVAALTAKLEAETPRAERAEEQLRQEQGRSKELQQQLVELAKDAQKRLKKPT